MKAIPDLHLSSFAISWVLTWFSHDLEKVTVVCRIFDFLLCSSPIMSVYLISALLIRHRDSILTIDLDDIVHMYRFLSKDMLMSVPIEQVIEGAVSLYNSFPLRKLKSSQHYSIGQYSCIDQYEQLFNTPKGFFGKPIDECLDVTEIQSQFNKRVHSDKANGSRLLYRLIFRRSLIIGSILTSLLCCFYFARQYKDSLVIGNQINFLMERWSVLFN